MAIIRFIKYVSPSISSNNYISSKGQCLPLDKTSAFNGRNYIKVLINKQRKEQTNQVIGGFLMKKTLFVLLVICVISALFITVAIVGAKKDSLPISQLDSSEKKEEVVSPPAKPLPTNREIIASNLILDNLTPEDVAEFLNLNLDDSASSPEVLARQVSRFTTFSGLLQAATEQSISVAPLFDAPEDFALVEESKIERNNEQAPWQKLVKGDRVDLVALDGQVVRLVASGLITKNDIKETVTEATSLPPELVDKLLQGDTKNLEQEALTSIKTYLTSYYGIPAGTLDALFSGNFNVSREMIEQLVLGRLINALGNNSQTISNTES